MRLWFLQPNQMSNHWRKQQINKNTNDLVELTNVTELHGRKWGQLTPTGKMDEKLNSVNMQKREQSGQADVANGAMLATYLFRYTSECIIS